MQRSEEYIRSLALSLSALSHQNKNTVLLKTLESRVSKPKYCPVFVFHSAGGANAQVPSHLAFYIGPGDFNSNVFIIANAAIHWTVSLVPSWHLMSNNS